MNNNIVNLPEFKRSFDTFLDSILEQEVASATRVSRELCWLLNTTKTFSLSGGKRLRPYLFYISYKGLVPEDENSLSDKDIIKLSVFIELIHLELLVLDDIMDKSPTRHGFETVHVQEKKKFSFEFGEAQAEHFGNSAGILSGVILGNIAMKSLSHFSDTINAQKILLLVEYYNDVIIKTAYGQFHDMYAASKENVSIQEVEMIHLYKTAKYTIEAPLVAAAKVLALDKDKISEIVQFAEPLGRAFQIVDDLIGTFGTDEHIGKSVKSDLEEGKHTLLTVKAHELGNSDEKKELIQLLSEGEVSNTQFNRFKELLVSTGSRKYSDDILRELFAESLQKLAVSSYNDSAKRTLEKLASFIIERDY